MEINLQTALEQLRSKRPIFRSESDFRLALAGELQFMYGDADIKLKYPTSSNSKMYIDILLKKDGHEYPIELRHKLKKLSVIKNHEVYHLKNHGAKDVNSYDFVQDICRIESLTNELSNFRCGFAIMLTNDPSYWTPPKNHDAGYVSFSIHSGALKTGTMKWGDSVGIGTTRRREEDLILRNEYFIEWNDYSDFNKENGVFKYALVTIPNDVNLST